MNGTPNEGRLHSIRSIALIVVWFTLSTVLSLFSLRAGGITLMLLGIAVIKLCGVKSRISAVLSGFGAFMFFIGIAMEMTGDRGTMVTMAFLFLVVFLLYAIGWNAKWIRKNLPSFLALSFVVSIYPVSSKISAFISSVIILFIVNSSLKEGEINMSEYTSTLLRDRTREGKKLIDEFVEKGEKVKLLTYLAYYAPRVIPQNELERIIGLIINYKDSKLLRWRNKRKRKCLVDEVMRRIGDNVKSGWLR